jgi:uncharacterized protein YqgC (DUF456 family)
LVNEIIPSLPSLCIMHGGFCLFYWFSSGCPYIDEYVVISVITILFSSAQFLKNLWSLSKSKIPAPCVESEST